MITATLLIIGTLWCMWKILTFGLRLSWSILKIVLSVAFLPLMIIGLFASGFIYLALIVLIVVGLVSLIRPAI